MNSYLSKLCYVVFNESNVQVQILNAIGYNLHET